MFEAEVAALLVLAALAAGWFMTTWGGKPVDTSSKIVFITGAGSGLGLACVRHLLRAGDTVIACDLHTAALEKMDAGGNEKLEILSMDVTDENDVSRCCAAVQKKFICVDCVINFAGIILTGPL